MLDYVTLGNLALQHLGEDEKISAPDEDSKPARTIKRAWNATRLFVLSQANWSFALRTLELTARPADPAWPIALGRTAFPLPADLVRLTEIVEPDLDVDDDQYSIECGPAGQELLVDDTGPITIRYVRTGADLEDPARWSSSFDEAFQFRLAWQISDPLSADKGRKDRALNSYIGALKDAKKANNKFKAPKGNAGTEWSRSRRSGSRPPGC